jgi:hypothetical protein
MPFMRIKVITLAVDVTNNEVYPESYVLQYHLLSVLRLAQLHQLTYLKKQLRSV